MRSTKGNILFLILIAVALFAALSYAVTNSSRTSSSAISEEKADILASQILSYMSQIQQEYNRMRVIHGFSAQTVDFGSDIFSRWSATPPTPWADNPNCTSADCRMFSSNGGNVPEITFLDAADLPWTQSYSSTHPYPGHIYAARVDVIDVGSDLDDLTIGIIRIKKEICDALNKRLGVPLTVSDTDESFGTLGKIGSGSDPNNYYSLDADVAAQIGEVSTEAQGKRAACIRANVYGYSFYYVLDAR